VKVESLGAGEADSVGPVEGDSVGSTEALGVGVAVVVGDGVAVVLRYSHAPDSIVPPTMTTMRAAAAAPRLSLDRDAGPGRTRTEGFSVRGDARAAGR
jgi:hypothetical protein